MDAKVDDFFNEINDIAPPPPPPPVDPKSSECVWKKCHDELTGYSYYWNMKTDVVTWEVPADYRPSKQTTTKKHHEAPKKKPPEIYDLKRIYPNVKIPEHSVKIYSIKDSDKNLAQPKKTTSVVGKKHNSDSEDEKITLISSYGGDSDSETEGDQPQIKKFKYELPKQDLSENEDDVDILAKIQKRAKELKELGGELPPEVAKIADIVDVDKKPVSTGISLVAGYSDSEEENDEIKTVFTVAPAKQTYSTLFPIAQKIDVKDFMEPKVEENKPEVENEFKLKAFTRKKRIGVSLVNTLKKNEDTSDDGERRGFGFSKNDEENGVKAAASSDKSGTYLGFTKGGVMFVKPENNNNSDDDTTKTDKDVAAGDNQEIEDMYGTLREKLLFLNEGRAEVPPTQIMLIQVETLYIAMSKGGLQQTYLRDWLKDTCDELVKLEKESTPEGWLLQWDRSHKRYYYQNIRTGASQWEYPQPPGPATSTTDVERCDDAMDISTTPPPEQTIRMSPPLPPIIRCPTPPPPPIISQMNKAPLTDVPLPPEPPPIANGGEPLPPGVDAPDNFDKKGVDDSLSTALDSFYSEVAAIDSPKSLSPQPSAVQVEGAKVEECSGESKSTSSDSSVKKKKKKVKLAPGLALKKKGVSQLVEKWKNVQQQFH